MLKNLDPVLSPELLATLCAMGHGDEIAIVDANYPAGASGRPVIRMDGVSATRALDAVLSVMPLDEYETCAAFRMQVVGDPNAEQPIFAEFRAKLNLYESKMATLGSIERFAFYDRAKRCYAIIATGEHRLYGNIILKKGVVRAAAADDALLRVTSK